VRRWWLERALLAAGLLDPAGLTVRWAWRTGSAPTSAAIPGDVVRAVTTSATTALVVLAVCALTLVVCARAAARAGPSACRGSSCSNYFLPSLVLALAFVMMSRDGSPSPAGLGGARDSRALIVVAEALRFCPFAMLPLLDALRAHAPAMIETARRSVRRRCARAGSPSPATCGRRCARLRAGRSWSR
jgi:ABC-type Fe3+ transport system permease subunit